MQRENKNYTKKITKMDTFYAYYVFKIKQSLINVTKYYLCTIVFSIILYLPYRDR